MALAASQLHDLTADDFFALADRLPRTAQLIDGEVVIMNSPSVRHQLIVGELYHRLRLWIATGTDRGLCGIEVDVKVDQRNAYAPDLWWFSSERLPDVGAVRLPALPDLAVEVLSPWNRRYDLGIKRQRYEERGLPELWLIDPASVSAFVLRRSSEPTGDPSPGFDVELKLSADDELTSPQLPGFSLLLGDLLPQRLTSAAGASSSHVNVSS